MMTSRSLHVLGINHNSAYPGHVRSLDYAEKEIPGGSRVAVESPYTLHTILTEFMNQMPSPQDFICQEPSTKVSSMPWWFLSMSTTELSSTVRD